MSKHRLELERELELELAKLRSAASAARLEARAAEVELLIRQLRQRRQADDRASTQQAADKSAQQAADESTEQAMEKSAGHATEKSAENFRFSSWAEVRDSLGLAAVEPTGTAIAENVGKVTRTADGEASDHLPGGRRRVAKSARRARKSANPSTPAKRIPATEPADVATKFGRKQQRDQPQRKRRPAAWIVSGVGHAILFLLLACWTLVSHKPRDQVSIAASVSAAETIPIETLVIETSEPSFAELTDTPVEPVYDVSPVGQFAVAEFRMESLVASTASLAGQMSGATHAGAAMSLQSDAQATMQFCGVDGGGNHFVYLVDSSLSMGDAFSSARLELLRSIELLTPEQRFYVIFFDAEPDFMRLANPDRDEHRSAMATPANKRRLRDWAMGISMDRGQAPYEPLKFALGLRPDVIFLLSDGEFPRTIEDILGDQNQVDNLFGDDDLVSIVHTIGYHSRDGESRMRRIAQQNGGQYRYIPAP